MFMEEEEDSGGDKTFDEDFDNELLLLFFRLLAINVSVDDKNNALF